MEANRVTWDSTVAGHVFLVVWMLSLISDTDFLQLCEYPFHSSKRTNTKI